MDKYSIIQKIENFAPPEFAEKWDCSGWLVETSEKTINKIMLALTITDDIYTQAVETNCDMIISHHPLFSVPLKYKNIDMYCAHTNMDLASGGTTDTLIKKVQEQGLNTLEIIKNEGYVRYVKTDVNLNDLLKILSCISKNLRYTNLQNIQNFKKIAFCAGSGTEFINEAFENGADAYISGDLKFHTALESPIPVFDIGHFESEIFILEVFKNLIGKNIDITIAKEKSPFIQI